MVVLLLLVLLLLGAAPGDDLPGLRRALQAQLQPGRHAEALETARRYVAVDPDDPDVWYNLAGLEEIAGNRDAAVAAFGRAVASGFDDVRAAEDDADLGELRRDPGFLSLRDAALARVRERAVARAVNLTATEWSPWRELADRRGGEAAPEARARWRCTGEALEVEAEIHDPHPRDALPPWGGGAGLLVAIGTPAAAGGADGTRWREVAAGLRQKVPAGAVLASGWQPVRELAPRLRVDPATRRLVYVLSVPWSVVAPHDPLLDDDLLVNVTYFSLAADGGRTAAALLADPATGDAHARWRRGVPLRVVWPAPSGPLLRARPAASVWNGRDEVVFAAVVVSSQPGPARWFLEGSQGAAHGAFTARGGRQEIDLAWRPAAVVAAGTRVTIAARVELPAAGADATSVEVVALPGDWAAQARRRARALAPAERPTVEARLDAVEAELAARDPRDPVGPLSTTAGEVEDLLRRFEAAGTILPAQGPLLIYLPEHEGAPRRPCALDVPAGFAADGAHLLLLLLLHAPGWEARGADQALRVAAEMAPELGIDPGRVAVAIPVAGGPRPPDQERAFAEVAQALAWAAEAMPDVPVALAGAGDYAVPALQISLERPAELAGVLLVTGPEFAVWAGADALALRAALSRGDPRLPYGWIHFPDEAGPADPAPDLIAALRDAGLALTTVQDVPGDLHASQACGRAVLWAAGLPRP